MVRENALHLYLGGHLSWYDSQKRKRLEIPLPKSTLLTQVLTDLNIPIAEIAVGVVNGNPVFLFDEVAVKNSDQVELYPPVGGGEKELAMALSANDILKAEFEYIAQTAIQANEDRARVSNYYFVTMGAAIGAILSAKLDVGSIAVHLAFAAVFAVLTFIGFSTLMQLARLRTAWQDSVRAMNVIKDFYVLHAQDFKLDAAFLWRSASVPAGSSKKTVSFFLALSILAVSFATATATCVYLGITILDLGNFQLDVTTGLIIGIVSFCVGIVIAIIEYKWYMRLVTESEHHQRERYHAHLEKYKTVLTARDLPGF